VRHRRRRRTEAIRLELDQLLDWALKRADRHDIPVRALQADGYATGVMAQARPECHLGWTTLAGIARVQSDHARFGGATIDNDGTVSSAIRGVELDGTGGNAVITEVASTVPGGHVVYARAMGPFQFIPDTWNRWGIRADSDYDVVAGALEDQKPVETQDLSGGLDNIHDAALSAARYLCAAGGDLSTAAGWEQAIFAYNHSLVYVDQVRSVAVSYDA
ncbi:hypothetical protein, partial [Nocardia sp. NPDC004722]